MGRGPCVNTKVGTFPQSMRILLITRETIFIHTGRLDTWAKSHLSSPL